MIWNSDLSITRKYCFEWFDPKTHRLATKSSFEGEDPPCLNLIYYHVTVLGYFWNVLETFSITKLAQTLGNFLFYFTKPLFLHEDNFGSFGENWVSFISSVWSHCSRVSCLFDLQPPIICDRKKDLRKRDRPIWDKNWSLEMISKTNLKFFSLSKVWKDWSSF